MAGSGNDRLRSAREATPSRWFPGRAMTRTELADLVVEHVWRHRGIDSPFDRKYLAKLESGRIRYPSARYREALAAILGASDADLGFVSANRERVAKPLDSGTGGDEGGRDGDGAVPRSAGELAALIDGHELDERTVRLIRGTWLAPVATGTRLPDVVPIGRELVAVITDRAEELRRLDEELDSCGSPAETAGVASRTEAVGHELLGALAELCLLAGWLAHDTGRRHEAARYHTAGVHAAHLAGDEPLAARLLATLTVHDAEPGDPCHSPAVERALRQSAASRPAPTVLERLGGPVAWTVARLGPGRGDGLVTAPAPDETGARDADHAGAGGELGQLARTGHDHHGRAPAHERARALLADAQLLAGDVERMTVHAVEVLARARARTSPPARRQLGTIDLHPVPYRDLANLSSPGRLTCLRSASRGASGAA